MQANPYQPPTSPPVRGAVRNSPLIGQLGGIFAWSQCALVFFAIEVLHSEGRVRILANPQYAGLFALAFFSGVTGAFLRRHAVVRYAALAINLANLSLWLIYVLPVARHPRFDEATGLAIGIATITFSFAILLTAFLSPTRASSTFSTL